MGDIVLDAGSNMLNVALTPVIGEVCLVPCAYCGAILTTEAGLVAHMESDHPNMPYLITCYPQTNIVTLGSQAEFFFKLSVPESPLPHNGNPFRGFYFKAYLDYPLAIGADIYEDGHYVFLEGVYDVRSRVHTKYQADPFYTLTPIPPGEYNLLTHCSAKWVTNGSYHTERWWVNAVTGAKVTIT